MRLCPTPLATNQLKNSRKLATPNVRIVRHTSTNWRSPKRTPKIGCPTTMFPSPAHRMLSSHSNAGLFFCDLNRSIIMYLSILFLQYDYEDAREPGSRSCFGPAPSCGSCQILRG